MRFPPFVALLTFAASLFTSARAETHLFLQNRGPDPLCVEGTTMKGGLASGAWRQPEWGSPPTGSAFEREGCRYLLGPQARIEFLRLNDDVGVTDGKSFWFETTLRSPGGQRTTLRHKLDGETIGSNLWRRVADAPFVDDDRTRRHAWLTDAGVRVIESGEDDGDFYYRVAAPLPGPAPLPGAGPGDVRLMTWNLGMLPTNDVDLVWKQLEHLGGYDVLVLTEVFVEEAKRRIKRALHESYPYGTTRLGGDPIFGQDGGVLILSRWPIEFQDEVLFGGGRGTDVFSDKGALYARIVAPFGRIHVVGSHTQSSANDVGSFAVEALRPALLQPSLVPRRALGPAGIRATQFRKLRRFLDGLHLPPDEPVLITGDLNVPRERDEEHATMLEILQALEVPGDVAGPTWDPKNSRVDDDEDEERLDYVLYDANHRAPSEGRVEVLRPRSEDADLSDHYAIAATLTFPVSPPLPVRGQAEEPAPLGTEGRGLFGLGW